MKIHNTFHISLLEPKPKNMRENPNAYPPEVDNENNDRDNTHYEVKRILGSEYQNGELFYLLEWDQHPGEDS